jgi:hypothetical protein
MIAEHDLVQSTEQTHQNLAAGLEAAAAMHSVPGQPRKGFEYADTFLAATSRHLNAVESVLLPAANKQLDDHDLVHDFVQASKALEGALVNAKGREYGSAYAVTMRWPEVWAAVRTRLEEEHRVERRLAERLTEKLDEEQVAELAERLERVEPDAPSRPHPHAPHLGAKSRVARRLLHAVDSFWDTAETRMMPEREHAEHKKPGLMAQYLLADPRFDEEESDEVDQAEQADKTD